MHRFFVTHETLASGQICAVDSLAHQLHAVLRLRPGAEIVLCDGGGREFLAQIAALDRNHATALILAERPGHAEPAFRLTLLQCALKADKFEWVLQKGTELGVARFVPVVSVRSVVRPAAALLPKYERWRAILREAAEQSRRTRLPELGAPADFAQALNFPSQLRLLPWEGAAAAAGLGQAVSTARSGDAALLVGAEGGFAAEEVSAAQAAGWRVVTLGARILRAETAALAAIAVIMDRQGELGGAGPS
jgi:16S rRNA (uracil1498-N3)-methyltransferase